MWCMLHTLATCPLVVLSIQQTFRAGVDMALAVVVDPQQHGAVQHLLQSDAENSIALLSCV